MNISVMRYIIFGYKMLVLNLDKNTCDIEKYK